MPPIRRGTHGFSRNVSLPSALNITHVETSIQFIEEKAAEWIDLYFEQANVFSAVIGILGIRALDSLSPYKKHKHPDIAQQRFPDLSLRGRLDPPADEALESKGSTRPWAIQPHYNHPGWYIVWRYHVDSTRMMKRGRPIVIWRVDIPFLRREDWKYEGSRAAEGHGGRTHTFGVRNPKATVSKAIFYQAPGIVLQQGRPVLAAKPRTRHRITSTSVD